MPLSLGEQLPSLPKAITQYSNNFDFSSFCKNNWTLIFSYPADQTPICTSEMIDLIRKKAEFDSRGCQVVGLSNDSKQLHVQWISELTHLANGMPVWFPIVSDEHFVISHALQMAPKNKRIAVRTCYLIDPELHVQLVLQVTQNTGRDFGEILRVLDSCQLNSLHKVVGTPAGWNRGDDVVILPNVSSPSQMSRIIPKVAPVPYLQFASLNFEKPVVSGTNTFSSLQPLFKRDKV